eukprot:6962084-Prymnesium_polylepis.2
MSPTRRSSVALVATAAGRPRRASLRVVVVTIESLANALKSISIAGTSCSSAGLSISVTSFSE